MMQREFSSVPCRMMSKCLGVAALFLFLAGCAGLGFLAQGFKDKVPPEYDLEDMPTLIVVDDSSRALEDPNIPAYVASLIGAQLVQEKVITVMVPTDKLSDYANQQGEAYHKTPLDQIGHDLGAKQVIYVDIVNANLNPEPGVFRPKATAQVRVVDVVSGKRLFPGENIPYKSVSSELRPIPSTGESQRGDSAMARRKLAVRLARDVARLFHEYAPRQPGEAFED